MFPIVDENAVEVKSNGICYISDLSTLRLNRKDGTRLANTSVKQTYFDSRDMLFLTMMIMMMMMMIKSRYDCDTWRKINYE
jgi:hypothetical protein